MKNRRRGSLDSWPNRLAGRVFLFICFFVFGLSSVRPSFGAVDVTSFVETIGNAFTNRYPNPSNPTVKTVTRMRLFNNRIYLGHGVTTTSLKTAPMDCWSIDLAQDAFVKDGMVFEEIIDQLRVFGGRLYMNGRDGMGQGSFHRLDTTKGWQTFKIGADAHYFDIMEFGGHIYSNYGDGTKPVLMYSSDDGATFNSVDLGTSGVGADFIEFNGKLYVTINKGSGAAGVPFLCRLDGGSSFTSIHADYADFYQTAGTVALPKEFVSLNNSLGVFIGAGPSGGNNAFFSTTDIEAADSAITQGPPAGLPAGDSITGYGAQTLRKYNNTLYASYNFKIGSVIWVALLESADGLNWTEKFRFTTGARARSMERAPNGDFYFGAFGTGSGEAAIPGNIWRVRNEVIPAPALPVVGLSADDAKVFESSGSSLSLRIRRAGPTGSPLTVQYQTSGAAVAGIDYSALSGSAVIPAGEQSTIVPIPIIVNSAITGQRSLIITLLPDAAYTISSHGSQTLTITDETAGGTVLPLEGLALWLRADMGVTADGGGKVSAWADLSGHGYSAAQLNASKQPTLVTGPNGLPAILFDGTDDWLDLGPINAEAYYTAIYFTNETAITTASQQALVNYMSYAEGGGSALFLGNGQTTPFSGSDVIGIYNQAWLDGNLPAASHLLAFSQTAPTTLFELRVDSVAKPVSFAPAADLRIITPNCDAVRIGTVKGTGQYFKGRISELIIYKRPLSPAEAAAVESYLRVRYSEAAGTDFRTTSVAKSLTISAASLLANDVDPQGDEFSFTSVQSRSAAGGVIRYSPSSSQIIYVPRAGFIGEDSFEYTTTDEHGTPATLEVIVAVVGLNMPPTPGADMFTRQPNKPISILYTQMLANDADPEDDALQIVAVMGRSPAGAKIVRNSTGVIYTAPAGFNGNDTFSYTVRDARGAMATATVTIKVGVASGTSIARSPLGLKLKASVAEGIVSVRAQGTPGAILQLDCARSSPTDWETACLIRTGPDGLAYFEEQSEGAAAFFRAAVVEP